MPPNNLRKSVAEFTDFIRFTLNKMHWAEMAPAANGTVSVDSEGGIHLADDAYTEALDFYKELLDLGLAAPVSNVEIGEDRENGEEYIANLDMPYSWNGMRTATEGWQQCEMQWGLWDFERYISYCPE